MKRKNLNRIVDDLGVQSEFRKSAVLALVHAAKPSAGFRLAYSIYAVTERLTAREVRGIDAFFRWASKRDDSSNTPNKQRHLSRSELIQAFDEFVPTRKGKLEEILRIDRSDGEYGVWMKWAKIVLDTDEMAGEPK